MNFFRQLFYIFILILISNLDGLGQKSQVGVFANYNSNWTGLNVETRYEFKFKNRILAASSISSNFRTSYGIRIGSKYDIFGEGPKIGLWVGFDLLAENDKSLATNNQNVRRLVFEFPIEYRNTIIPNINFILGLIPNTTFHNSADLKISPNLAIRLGIQYLI